MKHYWVAVLGMVSVAVWAAQADISPVGKVRVAGAGGGATQGAAPAAEKSAKEIYTTSCAACHGTGAAGAPKLGDVAAWAPRIGTGMDALVQAAIGGKGAMPPKGGAMSLSDAEIQKTVEYMVEASK